MWTVVPDESVRHAWQCPECNEVANCRPDIYQDSGTPVCAACDCDMEYRRTWVRMPEVTNA